VTTCLQGDLVFFLIMVFCAWHVSRGGRIWRMILIVASGLSYVSAALAAARSWDLLIVALTIIYAIQRCWSIRRLRSYPAYSDSGTS
jgi:hypothetical protein